MKKTLLKLSLLTAMLIPSMSHAFIIEPWAGYALSGGDNNSDITGPAFGLRAGYSFIGGFQIGGEYFTAAQEAEYTILSTTTTYDFDQTGMGAFIGWDLPAIPLRFYLTYFFDSEVEFTPSFASIVDKLKAGSGTKIGVGFTGLPFIVLNLEYQSITYDEAELLGQTVTLSDISTSDFGYDTIFLSVSLPLP